MLTAFLLFAVTTSLTIPLTYAYSVAGLTKYLDSARASVTVNGSSAVP